MTIVDMLINNARNYPDKVALVELAPTAGFRKEVTWKELEQGSAKLASALIRAGIKKDDKVLHFMTNSITWLEAYFGIIRTGAWAVPLNYRFNAKDFLYCAQVSEARMLIMGQAFVDRVMSVKNHLTYLEKMIVVDDQATDDLILYKDFIATGDPNDELYVPKSDDVCGLYFTSGTTGDPKPIVLPHKNMEHAAKAEQMHHMQTIDDNFMLIPPLYHCGAKMHWFGSLMTASKAVLLNEVSPKTIIETMSKEKCTIAWLLVPWAQDILVALDKGEIKLEDYDLKQWRLMHIGAQPVPKSLIMHWKDYFPDMLYDTNYGLSECTGPGCVHLGVENIHKVGAIGVPGYGWECKIVDKDMNPVKQGEVGELLLRGDGVMREYYKNPKKTAETIMPDGFLRTGDVAKMDEDGFIYLVDRIKDLIIVGGENVYPVEVEDMIRTNPAVLDVAVIGVPDDRLGEIVVAIIKTKPGMELSNDEIKAFCDIRLPRYKRPRIFVFGEVMRNPTGKIEKPKMREKYAYLANTAK